MNFNNLLASQEIDPERVLVLRHRPNESALRKVLPWLAVEKPDVFNAYQQTQGDRVERAMQGMTNRGYVASFIGHEPGRAVFIGLYAIGGSRPLTRKQFWEVPGYQELKTFGMRGFADERPGAQVLWFDLTLMGFYTAWKGKLIIGWPGLERAWWRRGHLNSFPIMAILEDSALDAALPEWDAIEFTWEELQVLPSRLKYKLREWRGVYFIFDISDNQGYVGSAYGEDNLLGRWVNYAERGHGGNTLLRHREPRNFRFSILQLVSPTMPANEVIQLESSWKRRLHTRQPHGLNDN
jgi:GIY-YIG catalytic domain